MHGDPPGNARSTKERLPTCACCPTTDPRADLAAADDLLRQLHHVVHHMRGQLPPRSAGCAGRPPTVGAVDGSSRLIVSQRSALVTSRRSMSISTPSAFQRRGMRLRVDHLA